ncbi:archease [Halodesulfurarchaeum sp.]|uniref:archease n=1 Tax=Halodesulfurarchaeum sp. TaxID=1980530 RepID=UPI001BBEB7E5|nr:archease [Halodesulfurarchaeum sp.]
MTGHYELKAHTADVAIEARGATLSEVFGAVADGLGAAHVDSIPELERKHLDVAMSAERKAALLFDYLDRLLYLRDVKSVLPVENDATVTESDDEWTVKATARGVPVSEIDAREVKAITYSEMELREQDDGWYAYVVVDV